jgi:transcriptional regulator with XRE-family HTH domain
MKKLNMHRPLVVSHRARSKKAMLTPKQLRAARALLGWSREQLAERSGVPAVTTRQFEMGKTDPKLTTVGKWMRACERAGVIFIQPDTDAGPGVRLKAGARKP